MYCTYCGSQIPDTATFCPNCGANVPKDKKEDTQSASSSFNEYYETDYSEYSTVNDSMAIVAYITWVGFIIAMCSNDKDAPFVKFHLNQALIINILSLIGFIPLVGWLIDLAVVVFWFMGITDACKHKMTPLPIIGDIKLLR